MATFRLPIANVRDWRREVLHGEDRIRTSVGPITLTFDVEASPVEVIADVERAIHVSVLRRMGFTQVAAEERAAAPTAAAPTASAASPDRVVATDLQTPSAPPVGSLAVGAVLVIDGWGDVLAAQVVSLLDHLAAMGRDAHLVLVQTNPAAAGALRAWSPPTAHRARLRREYASDDVASPQREGLSSARDSALWLLLLQGPAGSWTPDALQAGADGVVGR